MPEHHYAVTLHLDGQHAITINATEEGARELASFTPGEKRTLRLNAPDRNVVIDGTRLVMTTVTPPLDPPPSGE